MDITILVLSLANVTPPSPSFLTLTSWLKLSIGTKRAISREERLKTQADIKDVNETVYFKILKKKSLLKISRYGLVRNF